jgi:hypothetical protein
VNGKFIIVLVSLALTFLSVYVYLQRTDVPINVADQSENPKIEITEYEYLKIKDDVITAKMTGKTAKLFDHGLLHLRGGFHGTRYLNEKRDEIAAGSADAEFPESQLFDSSKQVKPKKVHVFEHIEAHRLAQSFSSEDVVYTEADQMVRSTVPAKVQEGAEYLTSAKGFEYHLASEKFLLFGQVEGIAKPSRWQNIKSSPSNTQKKTGAMP